MNVTTPHSARQRSGTNILLNEQMLIVCVRAKGRKYARALCGAFTCALHLRACVRDSLAECLCTTELTLLGARRRGAKSSTLRTRKHAIIIINGSSGGAARARACVLEWFIQISAAEVNLHTRFINVSTAHLCNGTTTMCCTRTWRANGARIKKNDTTRMLGARWGRALSYFACSRMFAHAAHTHTQARKPPV